MTEAQLRDLLVERSASLYQRLFSVGSAGNISARLEDGFLITPTDACLGFLDPAALSKLDRDVPTFVAQLTGVVRLIRLAKLSVNRDVRVSPPAPQGSSR